MSDESKPLSWQDMAGDALDSEPCIKGEKCCAVVGHCNGQDGCEDGCLCEHEEE
jgi:hypothetical protein